MIRICTICVRGGSKGIANKNLIEIKGKPLLVWSIDQARASGLFAAVAVSSDSPAILDVAASAGADVLVKRPDELASDTAPKIGAIRHAYETAVATTGLAPASFVDLDATSPLRLPEDIVGAVELLERTGCPNVITGSPARRSPYFNLVEERPDGTVGLSKPGHGIVRRQDAPRAFDMNASIYAWNVEAFLANPAVFYPETRLFEMPEERSIDIDGELDLAFVRHIMARRTT